MCGVCCGRQGDGVVRRVVTGHDERGRSAVVSDDEAFAIAYGSAGGLSHVLWVGTMSLTSPTQALSHVGAAARRRPVVAASSSSSYLRARRTMHATPTTDFDIILNGTVGLELDDGKVILQPGDIVVQNGTLHRWHNRGSTVARIVAGGHGLLLVLSCSVVPPPVSTSVRGRMSPAAIHDERDRSSARLTALRFERGERVPSRGSVGRSRHVTLPAPVSRTSRAPTLWDLSDDFGSFAVERGGVLS
jgi:mannose-6-phosphate isomerase-like protein (cupin superfamily)